MVSVKNDNLLELKEGLSMKKSKFILASVLASVLANVSIGNIVLAASSSINIGGGTVINGSTNTLTDNGTVAIGNKVTAAGTSVVIGTETTAVNTSDKNNKAFATVIGYKAQGTNYEAVAIGYASNASAKNSTALGTKATSSGYNSLAVGNYVFATGSDSAAIGSNTTTSSNGSTAVGNYSKSTGLAATALGYNSRSTVFGGTALGALSVASRESGYFGYDPTTNTNSTSYSNTWHSTLGAVSLGTDNYKRQIINLAAGTEDTDAVNVAQLKAVRTYATYTAGDAVSVTDNSDGSHILSVNYGDGLHLTSDNKLAADVTESDINTINSTITNIGSQVTTNTNNISSLNTTVTNIGNQVDTNTQNIAELNKQVSTNTNSINKLGHDITRVGAMSAALAGLHPMDFDPDNKFNVAVAGGFYKDKQALALGAFYHPNEETMFSVGTTVGNNDNMVNIGASFKVGQTTTERKFKEQYKTAPISTVYVLEDKVNSLEKENAELKETVAKLVAKVGL